MLYIPIHNRTNRRYEPVTEHRKIELESHPATANAFRFELVKDSALNKVQPEPTSEASAKKPKTKKQETANEQSIDSGVGSEPLQEN